ncbi:3-oxoacyl-[acyl-carrier-protein] synthase-3 [Nitrospirillum viridazoti]|nr:3-oxoacyl-[acyl-carrier-protein] synthase-3 [Nitrospirillum amazonense]
MMAAAAIGMATDGLPTGLDSVDRLIVASIMSEQPIPTTAALTAARLSLGRPVAAYDINASCLGFLQAVEGAAMAIATGQSHGAAVVATDLARLGLDRTDRTTAPLFGDGAAAAILTPSDGASAILAIALETHPIGGDLCEIRAGGSRFNPLLPPPSLRDYLFRMDGVGLVRLAMTHLPGFIERVLSQAGVGIRDIACVIPHQASRQGLKFLRNWLGPDGPPMVDILATQVSASLPTALHEAVTSRLLRRGQLGLMVGTAAGFGMGAMVFRF